MKRAAALILLLTALLSLSCCAGGKSTEAPVTVGGVKVDAEIFRYFLNEIWDDPQYQTKSARIDRAARLCVRYVAVNSAFRDAGLSLSAGEKVSTNETSNALWQKFGAYYTALGISKQTFLKVRLSGEYEENLREAYFGAGAPEEISEPVLRGYLREYFYAFKMISAPLKTSDVYGNERVLNQAEKAALELKYSNAAADLNNGLSYENVTRLLCDTMEASLNAQTAIVVNDDNREFSPEFCQSVKTVTEGSAGLFEDADNIYLIYRLDILADENIFRDFRPQCLKMASERPFEEKINQLCAVFSPKMKAELTEKCYKETEKVKEDGSIHP